MTQKECGRVRDAHILETALGKTSQDTKRKRPSEGHSLPGDRVGKDRSGHGKKATE